MNSKLRLLSRTVIVLFSIIIALMIAVVITTNGTLGVDLSARPAIYGFSVICVIINVVFIIDEINYMKWWKSLSSTEKHFYMVGLD